MGDSAGHWADPCIATPLLAHGRPGAAIRWRLLRASHPRSQAAVLTPAAERSDDCRRRRCGRSSTTPAFRGPGRALKGQDDHPRSRAQIGAEPTDDRVAVSSGQSTRAPPGPTARGDDREDNRSGSIVALWSPLPWSASLVLDRGGGPRGELTGGGAFGPPPGTCRSNPHAPASSKRPKCVSTATS